MSSLPTLPFLTDTTTTVSSQPLLPLSQPDTTDNIRADSNQSSIEPPILRSNQPDPIDDHPASSQVWRSLLAERMARSQDDQRRLRPLEAFERAVEARRRERDAHLELAADARRREREAQRNLMDVQRETLRAAERTISLLREQIRLHDERARLSLASLIPSPAPADTPARTPTQRAALERSLSTRIASLQADIERERRRAGLSGPMRRPETEAAARVRANSLASAAVACPQEPTLTAPVPCRHHPILQGHSRGSDGSDDELRLSGCTHNSSPMEREWDRQLANGEVDANGIDLGKGRNGDGKLSATNVGHRHVEGLGLQSASEFASAFALKPCRSNGPRCLR
ncbi:uncharacterized protein MELLADRAFT_118594 [Melampsora larici-populina 98AG31]|uniref:Uncharacterized protein n=1 Tax=Melampsora larici-populina (strain 98AG31 / pathotype 3-4-7) TaxID=747676 RepID=F4SB34_MELLP|nr:uncharacterized protein MELLADRAFT_118594 [Melampsora larici-populina 98AG31]EGF98123.1 hypothetical protein MELLADRAFT_118594 [Melampsora larici-populina 98AG31]